MSKINKKILKFSDFATPHAEKRAQGRSNYENVDILMNYADRITHLAPKKKGDKTRYALTFTKKWIDRLVKNGTMDQQTSDKCKNLVVVRTSDEVITVCHQLPGKKGRVYRKNIKKNYRDRYFKKK